MRLFSTAAVLAAGIFFVPETKDRDIFEDGRA
mgnify:CR=1 FL=1